MPSEVNPALTLSECFDNLLAYGEIGPFSPLTIFLKYLYEQHPARIKSSALNAELFAKPTDFLVRKAASNLRRSIPRYYATTTGRQDPFRFEVDTGPHRDPGYKLIITNHATGVELASIPDSSNTLPANPVNPEPRILRGTTRETSDDLFPRNVPGELRADSEAEILRPHSELQRLDREDVSSRLSKYLESLILRCSEVPRYFPKSLRSGAGFATIRQRVLLATDPEEFDSYRAEQRERRRSGSEEHEPYYSHFEEPLESVTRHRIPPEILEWSVTHEPRNKERFRRTVILGDPGFGKTWLLRHEGIRLARAAQTWIAKGSPAAETVEIPVFLPLPDIARCLPSEGSIERAIIKCLKHERVLPSGLEGHFTGLFESGRLTLLLDAWDEVTADQLSGECEDPRHSLGKEITAFSRAHKGRIVITSRNTGHTSQLMPNAAEMVVLAFSPAEVHAFAASWFKGNRHRLTELAEELEKHPQVGGLARIPLLLSLICRIFQEPQSKFPLCRAELYEKTLHGLLFDWQAEDKLRNIPLVLRQVLFNQLARAAWSFQLLEQFDDVGFAEGLGFNCSQDAEAAQAHTRIEELLQSGVLVRAGQGKLMFLHRTFQEYLTAMALAKRKDLPDYVDELSLDPAWHEVIVLLGAHADPALIVTILCRERRDCITSPLYPRLALAGRMLGEGVTSSTDEIRSLRQSICDRLWTVWKNARQASQEEACDHVVRGLVGLLTSDPGLRVRSLDTQDRIACWTTLGAVAFNSPAAREYVVEVLLRPKSPARKIAARIVKGLGRATLEGAIHRLIQALGDADAAKQRAAVAALGFIGSAGAEEAFRPLILALRDPRFPHRAGAAWALGQLGAAIAEQAIGPLVTVLQTPDFPGREAAAVSLGLLGCSLPSKVVGPLIRALDDSRYSVRVAAADALGKLGPAVARRAARPLAQLLTDRTQARYETASLPDKPSAYDREVAFIRAATAPYPLSSSAAVALSALGPEAAGVAIRPLIQALHDPTFPDHWAVARALADLCSPKDAMVVEALLQALVYPEFVERRAVAEALGRFGPAASARGAEVLVRALGDQKFPDRPGAAEALGYLGGPAAEKAVQPLIRVLRDAMFPDRSDVVEALGRLGSFALEEVLDPLLEAISDVSFPARASAVHALGTIGPLAAERVVGPLIRTLQDAEFSDRAVAANALADLGPNGGEQALEALVGTLSDKDETIRRAAADALGNLLVGGLPRRRRRPA